MLFKLSHFYNKNVFKLLNRPYLVVNNINVIFSTRVRNETDENVRGDQGMYTLGAHSPTPCCRP